MIPDTDPVEWSLCVDAQFVEQQYFLPAVAERGSPRKPESQ